MVRKKEKAKKRVEADRRREKEQPARKRRKVAPNNNTRAWSQVQQKEVEEAHVERSEFRKETPKKRKVGREEKRSPKKQRKNLDIKRYISCKKWRQEDQERQQEKEDHTTAPHEHQHQQAEPQLQEPDDQHVPEAGQHGQEVQEGGKHHQQADPQHQHPTQEDVQLGDHSEADVHHHHPVEEIVSCAISMLDRMPSSIVWAPQGGIAPSEPECKSVLTSVYLNEQGDFEIEEDQGEETRHQGQLHHHHQGDPHPHQHHQDQGGTPQGEHHHPAEEHQE